MRYNGPERRRWYMRPVRVLSEFGNKPVGRWHHIWRDFVPLIALVIAAYAVISVENKVDDADVKAATAKVEAATAKRLAATQTEGRRVSVGIICGALRGVEDAGRLVITGRLPGTVRYTPARSRRERRIAQIFAESYNRVITRQIVKEAGANGQEVIEPNGSVNCKRLRKVAKTPKTP